jgi:hypothetical protein
MESKGCMRQKAAPSAISATHEEALRQYAGCDIRLVTGCGPWETSGPTYRMSAGLANRGIAHHLDDGGRKAATTGPTGITRCGST